MEAGLTGLFLALESGGRDGFRSVCNIYMTQICSVVLLRDVLLTFQSSDLFLPNNNFLRRFNDDNFQTLLLLLSKGDIARPYFGALFIEMRTLESITLYIYFKNVRSCAASAPHPVASCMLHRSSDIHSDIPLVVRLSRHNIQVL